MALFMEFLHYVYAGFTGLATSLICSSPLISLILCYLLGRNVSICTRCRVSDETQRLCLCLAAVNRVARESPCRPNNWHAIYGRSEAVETDDNRGPLFCQVGWTRA